ncbi:MAG: hypothetical protein HQ526_04740 [Actinobacteria bacterium]|nr:hypothetical protein [Actinomycetota bacterium]
MSSPTHPATATPRSSRRYGFGVRSAALASIFALAAAGLTVAVAGGAQANGNCPTYWGAGTGSWSGAPAAGGTGTPEDPYQVADQTDLQELLYCDSSHFTQTADIALAGEWDPLPTFAGSYQGNGRAIDGLTNTSNSATKTALIEVIDGGVISELNLTNVDISSPDYRQAAALAGVLIGGGSVSGVSASGSVAGKSSVGGLIGYAEGSEISNSSADVTTNGAGDFVGGLLGWGYEASIAASSASGAVTGVNSVGGLVGVTEETPSVATITDSSASGNVTGNNSVGGLVGTIYGATIETSSAAGSVVGNTQVGGLLGRAAGGAHVIADAFATGSSTATGGSAGGLIGENASTDITIDNSYQSGAVSASGQAGGLIGALTENPASVTESFWNSSANPSLSGGAGQARSQAQLRELATFTSANWSIQSGSPATGGNLWGICVPSNTTVNSGFPFHQYGLTSNICPVIPGTLPQVPANNCVPTGSSRKAIPRKGSFRLMKSGCRTNAGERIAVNVRASLRGDVSYYKLICKASGKKSKVRRNGSGYFCKTGKLKIRTSGSRLRLRVTWSAPAEPGFEPFLTKKVYRT